MTARMTRRQALKLTLGAAAGAVLAAQGSGVTVGPGGISLGATPAFAFSQSDALPKFKQRLRSVGADIPVAVSDGDRHWLNGAVSTTPDPTATKATHYTIEIGQFSDFLQPSAVENVPSSVPTRLWGYNPVNPAGTPTPRHLGGIIATKKGTPVQITFRNNLPAAHILPVDPTLMGMQPGDAVAVNRAAVHLHGGYVPWISDGGPFDWWKPDGTRGPSFLNNAVLNPGAAANEAEYYYPNQQSARMMWYHDHAWGTTRLNAYAGVASGYVVYDDYELSLGTTFGLPGPLDPKTIYMVFQDKIFVPSAAANGSAWDPTWNVTGTNPGDLWYAHTYETARWGALGPATSTLPDPSVIPEFFGDTILVNGTVSPYLEVEPRQYRFRMLNACNARFLNPRLVAAQTGALTEPSPNVAGPSFLQIGNEGGFLPQPTIVSGPKTPLLLLAPAERADLIVDFRGLGGQTFILYSDAPAPFPGGDPRNDYYPGNPKTPTSMPGSTPNTRTLLQIRVKKVAVSEPTITLPATLSPTDPFLVPQTPGVANVYPAAQSATDPSTGTTQVKLGAKSTVPKVTATVRYLTLNEAFDARGRLIQQLGTNLALNPAAKTLMYGRDYLATPSEVVSLSQIDPRDNATRCAFEIWEIANLTADVHPMHFHLVDVQVLNRQAFNGFAGTLPNYQGTPIAPDVNELGWKETVRMYPGQVTRVLMQFTLPSVPFTQQGSPRQGSPEWQLNPKLAASAGHEYVWHCHILEHEEHDMMRPLVVIP